MKMFQQKYSDLLEAVLQFLWRQWSAIGVAGATGVSENDRKIVDPEALLLFSFSLGRYDPRLFDEIIDWLSVNGQFINIKRLVSLQEKYQFNAGPQISAVAEYFSRHKEFRLKWEKLSSLYKNKEEQKLFYSVSGKELPVKNPDPVFLEKGLVRNALKLRGYSSEFSPSGISSLLLRLRAFVGVNARSELLCLLGSRDEIFPADAARLTGYKRRTLQSILLEFSKSGYVEDRSTGKEKYYRLKHGSMPGVLPENYEWVHWAPLFKGVEIFLNGIKLSLNIVDELFLSTELRRSRKEAAVFFNNSSTGLFLSDDTSYPGEALIDVVFEDIDGVISMFEKY